MISVYVKINYLKKKEVDSGFKIFQEDSGSFAIMLAMPTLMMPATAQVALGGQQLTHKPYETKLLAIHQSHLQQHQKQISQQQTQQTTQQSQQNTQPQQQSQLQQQHQQQAAVNAAAAAAAVVAQQHQQSMQQQYQIPSQQQSPQQLTPKQGK